MSLRSGYKGYNCDERSCERRCARAAKCYRRENFDFFTQKSADNYIDILKASYDTFRKQLSQDNCLCSGYLNPLNTPRINAGPENSCGILLALYTRAVVIKKVRNSRVWSFPIEGSDTRRFLEGLPRNPKVPLRPRVNGDFVCLDLRQGRSPRIEARNRRSSC